MAIKANKIIRVIIMSLVAIGTAALLYLMINNFQFRKGTSIKVLYDRIGALNVGSWVRKSGVKVGSVTKLEINKKDQRSVYVTITMKPGQIVRKADRFAIVVRGIMGDQYIEIFPGPLNSPPVHEGYVFKGEPMLDTSSLLTSGMDMLKDVGKSIKIIADILTSNKSSINNTILNLEDASKSLDTFIKQTKKLTDTIPEITETIKTTLARINDLTASLQENIGGTLKSENKSIKETIDNLNSITNSVKLMVDALSQQSSLVTTMSDPKLSRQIEDTLGNLKKVSDNIMDISNTLQKTVNDLLGPVNNGQ
ncbi:MAG: hypothetical protein DRP57_01765 [Spirochaetes bacterium]|nr:MAG: hypothetical protein DRP57_01765 [Spirochaetota bacterium]